LAWLEGTYTLRILEDFFDLLIKIGPYLLVSIALNVVVLRYFRGKRFLFSNRSELLSIIFAALIGLISPLPTYAAIPIGLSLIPTGIPFSAVLSFVISSPLMNPSIFFLTATQLGMEMALARTFTAFLLGIIGGIFAMTILRSIYNSEKTIPANPTPSKRTVASDIYHNTKYVAKYFSIAILLSAAVKALVPPEAIASLLGGNTKTGTLIAIGMGVPFYSCGGAAIPFIETLMELGMSKGATLAFFIAGPATKLETLYAFKNMLGTKVLIFYLTLTFVFSFIAGSVYSLF
jgi:uncharacterized protein